VVCHPVVSGLSSVVCGVSSFVCGVSSFVRGLSSVVCGLCPNHFDQDPTAAGAVKFGQEYPLPGAQHQPPLAHE